MFPVYGDDRDRTGDLWLAKPPLSQLSYVPGKDLRLCWQDNSSPQQWWALVELNHRPRPYQGRALAD